VMGWQLNSCPIQSCSEFALACDRTNAGKIHNIAKLLTSTIVS
jgi:hypothetical protein